MKRLDKKGFTLTELLATIAILGIIVTLIGVSITTIMDKAEDNQYKLLKENIRTSIETYYNECKYGRVPGKSYAYCNGTDGNIPYTVKASVLMTNGYINPNNNGMLVNPNDDTKRICNITYKYNTTSKKIEITNIVESTLTDTNC